MSTLQQEREVENRSHDPKIDHIPRGSLCLPFSMIVDKPPWVVHLGGNKKPAPIYSLDVHPSGDRLATGGGDNLVKLWRMAALIDAREEEETSSTPNLLAALNTHERAVNCVRWSKNGTYLASGSDDQSVIIWALSDGAASGWNSGGAVNIENWRAVTLLRGHTMDVLGVEWGPDSSQLASCSIDNTVRIWDAATWAVTKVLTQHTSLVKGVSWDVLGKFLITQADDNTAVVWRIADWSIENKVKEVFAESTEAFFRRACWSPDGSYVTLAAGFKNGHHAAVALQRGSWEVASVSGGHGSAVLCAKWSPRVLHSPKDNSAQMVWALGSAEPKLSIWTTERETPLLLIAELFGSNKAVVDLCWSPDGLVLIACSLDGTVACIQFEAKELGSPASAQEQALLLQQQPGAVLDSAVIPEGPHQILAPKKGSTAAAASAAASPLSRALNAQRTKPASAPSTKPQTETRMPNGKKRICPQRVEPQVAGQPQQMGGMSSAGVAMGAPPAVVSSPHKRQRLQPQSLSLQKSQSGAPVAPAIAAVPAAQQEVVVAAAAARVMCHLEECTIEVIPQPDQSGWVHCTCSSQNSVVSKWSYYTATHGTAVTMCAQMVVVGCQNGHLYVLSPRTGKQLLPVMQLSAAVSFVACSGGHVAALCADAQLAVWNLPQHKQVSRASAAALLRATPQSVVTDLSLQTEGFAILHLQSGVAAECSRFGLSPQLGNWLCLSEPVKETFEANLAAAIRPRPESVIANIETQLHAATLLGDCAQQLRWFEHYVQHLTAVGSANRLSELCAELSQGEAAGVEVQRLWLPTIPGRSRQDMLHDVVAAMKSNQQLHDLVAEYGQLVEASSLPVEQRGLAQLL